MYRKKASVPWHKRYKYVAVNIERTSREVIVALADIKANELLICH